MVVMYITGGVLKSRILAAWRKHCASPSRRRRVHIIIEDGGHPVGIAFRDKGKIRIADVQWLDLDDE
jgi:hypothetical protein